MSFAPLFYSHETVGKCLLLYLAETDDIKRRAPTCQVCHMRTFHVNAEGLGKTCAGWAESRCENLRIHRCLTFTPDLTQRQGLIKALAAIAMEPRELRISAVEVSLSPSLVIPIQLVSPEELNSTTELFHTARDKTTFSVNDARCGVGFHLRPPCLGSDERIIGPTLVMTAFWHLIQKHLAGQCGEFCQTLFDAVLRGILENTRVDSDRLFASLVELGYTPIQVA